MNFYSAKYVKEQQSNALIVRALTEEWQLTDGLKKA